MGRGNRRAKDRPSFDTVFLSSNEYLQMRFADLWSCAVVEQWKGGSRYLHSFRDSAWSEAPERDRGRNRFDMQRFGGDGWGGKGGLSHAQTYRNRIYTSQANIMNIMAGDASGQTGGGTHSFVDK